MSVSEAVCKPVLTDMPDLLTVQHIAALTGLAEQTVRRSMAMGELPSCRIGRRLYCPKVAFEKFAGIQ